MMKCTPLNHETLTAPRAGAPLCSLYCVLLSVLLGACSSINSAAPAYAAQNESAIRRQQAEQDRPRIDNEQVYLDMIREMQERSLYFASLAHIDAYLKTYASTPEVQRLRADALRATGQPDAAEAQYRTLLSGTEAAAAWHGLGLLAGQRGDYPAAIADFRAAIQRDPTNAGMLSDLGYALMQDRDWAAARLPLMQAIELMPDNRKIVSNLALYLLLSNDSKTADGIMARAGFPAEVKAEIARQAVKLGGRNIASGAQNTAVAVLTPQAGPAASRHFPDSSGGNDINDGFMQPMLQRFSNAH